MASWVIRSKKEWKGTKRKCTLRIKVVKYLLSGDGEGGK